MSMTQFMRDFERPFWLNRDFLRDDFFSPLFQDFYAPEFFKPWDNDFRPWENDFRPWKNVFGPWENYMKPFEELSDAMNHLAVKDSGNITTDDEKFQVNVDVQHFAPEEINVKVVDGSVIVEGKHEEKRDQHGYVSRQFLRRYALPDGCLPDTVESKLSSDGVLTVTAPKVLALPSIGEKIVPITQTGPVKKQLSSQEDQHTIEE